MFTALEYYITLTQHVSYHPSGAEELGLALFTTQKSKRKIIFYQLSVISRTKPK